MSTPTRQVGNTSNAGGPNPVQQPQPQAPAASAAVSTLTAANSPAAQQQAIPALTGQPSAVQANGSQVNVRPTRSLENFRHVNYQSPESLASTVESYLPQPQHAPAMRDMVTQTLRGALAQNHAGQPTAVQANGSNVGIIGLEQTRGDVTDSDDDLPDLQTTEEIQTEAQKAVRQQPRAIPAAGPSGWLEMPREVVSSRSEPQSQPQPRSGYDFPSLRDVERMLSRRASGWTYTRTSPTPGSSQNNGTQPAAAASAQHPTILAEAEILPDGSLGRMVGPDGQPLPTLDDATSMRYFGVPAQDLTLARMAQIARGPAASSAPAQQAPVSAAANGLQQADRDAFRAALMQQQQRAGNVSPPGTSPAAPAGGTQANGLQQADRDAFRAALMQQQQRAGNTAGIAPVRVFGPQTQDAHEMNAALVRQQQRAGNISGPGSSPAAPAGGTQANGTAQQPRGPKIEDVD